MGRGGTHLDMKSLLAKQAERIERRAERPTPKDGRGRQLVLTARKVIREREASNVVELRPHDEDARPAPEPSSLTVDAYDLAHGEAALSATLNAALMEGIGEARRILNNPYATDGKKMQTLALLVKVKERIDRAQLKSAREVATQIDLANASAAERSEFHNLQGAARLALAGYGVIAPDGRPIIPRERREAMPVGDDDNPPMDCDIPPEVRARRAAAAKAAPFVPQQAVDHSPEAQARRDAEMIAEARARR
jgi:hypothetical protein